MLLATARRLSQLCSGFRGLLRIGRLTDRWVAGREAGTGGTGSRLWLALASSAGYLGWETISFSMLKSKGQARIFNASRVLSCTDSPSQVSQIGLFATITSTR